MLVVLLVNLLLATLVFSEECITPDKKEGTCMLLSECPSLVSIIKGNRNRNSTVFEFLKQYHCGFDKFSVKVCCLDNSSIEANSLSIEDRTGLDLLPNVSHCGTIYENKMISKSEVTELLEFPWTVLIQYEDAKGINGFRCSGSLINNRYVLTAAHCLTTWIKTLKMKIKSVRLGEHDLASSMDCFEIPFSKVCSPTPLDIEIAEIIPHELYDINSFYTSQHDIGLIRLAEEVTFSEYIQPICLPIYKADRNETLPGKFAYLPGWGTTEQFISSNVKLKTTFRVVDHLNCTETYQNSFNISIGSGQICANNNQTKENCRYDGGSPLMHVAFDDELELHWYAMGVNSYGLKCIRAEVPHIFTKVKYYMDWILSKLKP